MDLEDISVNNIEEVNAQTEKECDKGEIEKKQKNFQEETRRLS